MPYPRTHTWKKWDTCPRCGLDWPIEQIHQDYTKIKVCPECYDVKGHKEYLANMEALMEQANDEGVDT